jgi:diguanylate cyclase (GGDEF)-like protein
LGGVLASEQQPALEVSLPNAPERRHTEPRSLRLQYNTIQYKLQNHAKTSQAVLGILNHLKGQRMIDAHTYQALAQPYTFTQELLPLHKDLGKVVFNDKLTGLGIRAEFDHDIQQLFTRSKEHKVPFSVMFLDLDHFKQINDAFGHDMGDVVLRHVGRTLRGVLPQGAKAYRYGGEELIVVAPYMHKKDCEALAHKLLHVVNITSRKSPQDMLINQVIKNPNSKQARDISLSIGALTYDGTTSLPSWAVQATDLTQSANALEHLAKFKGRNQCALAKIEDLTQKPKVGHYTCLMQESTTLHGPKVKLPV